MAKPVGWISLYRSSFNNKLYFEETFTKWQAWCDMLLLAKHYDELKAVRGIKFLVKRGQVGESSVELAKRWKWSRGRVERFLNYLENEKQIEQQKSNVTTLVSILNYNEYQRGGTAEVKNGQQNVQQNGQQNGQQKSPIIDYVPSDYPPLPY